MKRSGTSLVKDRKILKRVDASAARRSVSGLLAALAVFVLLASWGNLYTEHEAMTLVYGLAIVVVSGYRLWLVARFDAVYGAGPARWRRLYGLGLVLHATVWGSLAATLIAFYGISVPFLITLVYVIGVSTALGTAWMGALRVRLLYPFFMIVPPMVMLASTASLDNLVMALLLLAYLGYLLQLYREQYVAFWHSVQRDRRAPVTREETARRLPQIQLSLVYRLAHEIRTPMNSIMGMLSLLRDTPLNEEQKEYRQLATQSGKLLLTMIDDVLDYSRILTGRITLNPEYFDLRSAVEEVLDAYGPAAQMKGLELNAVLDRHLPTRMRGDRDRIMQILSNLVSNAIKFSDKGDVLIRIDYDVNAPQAQVQIQVVDQGQGMDAETATVLFHDVLLDEAQDMFASRRTGFGLLVCKGLVDAMSGRIWVHSVVGEGSTFHVTLPLASRPEISTPDRLMKSVAGRTAVLCGCSPGTRDALAEELEALEMNCHGTSDYDHALQVLRESHREHLDVMLLVVDTWQRRESALNLCRTVINDPTLQAVRIILQTTVSERGDSAVQALSQKSSQLEVLVKPAHRRALRVMLEKGAGLDSVEPVADRVADPEKERQHRKAFRLLLVEDNEVNQIVTRGMLDRLGYQVKTVSSGESALTLIGKEHFDLVLMDCMMPDMDGFETTRRMREREKDTGEHVPVVAMTANTVEGAQARCLAAGMDDYLAKPVHLEDLETMLGHWLPPVDNPGQRDDVE